jgi:hypothetical protein
MISGGFFAALAFAITAFVQFKVNVSFFEKKFLGLLLSFFSIREIF